MVNPNTPSPHTDLKAGPASQQPQNISAGVARRPSNVPTLDYESTADSEDLMERPRREGQAVEDLTTQVYNPVDGSGPSDRPPNEGPLLAVSSADIRPGILNHSKKVTRDSFKNLLRKLQANHPENPKGPPEPPVYKALEDITTAGASASSGPPLGGHDGPDTSDRSSAAVSTMGRSVIDQPSLIVDQIPPLDSSRSEHSGFDNSQPRLQNPGVQENRIQTAKSWKLTEIDDPSQCRSIRLRDTDSAESMISKLIYTSSGFSLLALCSSGVNEVWKWVPHESNPSGHSTASFPPQRHRNQKGVTMTNDIDNINTTSQEAIAFIALASNDDHLMSASGRMVSIFNMTNFVLMKRFMPPPPTATFLAVLPEDNNIFAIGMEDGTIQIYYHETNRVKRKLKGHMKRIKGLTFSKVLNVLVSMGADAQLCVWGTDGWEKKMSRSIETRPGPDQTAMGGSRLQFHNDQKSRLLVLHESQLAIYDVATLKRILRWIPGDTFSASISDATYSCDSLLVFAGFADGSICVFDGDTLQPRCRLSASVHIPPGTSGGTRANPFVIAAHPIYPNQFALGLSDGGVQLIEPLESEGQWGVSSSSFT